MDSDSENEKPQEEIRHKIRCKDMNLKQSKEIISCSTNKNLLSKIFLFKNSNFFISNK